MNVQVGKQVLLIRWLLIIATSYLVFFTQIRPSGWNDLLIVGYIISNIALSLVPPRFFESPGLYYALVPFDTAVVSLALYVSGNAGTDFYLIFLLVIIIAAIGRNLVSILVGASAICLTYGWALWSQNAEVPLIRFIFLLVVAIFIGYLVEQFSLEREKNRRLVEDKLELQEMEAHLRDSEAKFRLLAESVATAIFIYQDNRLQYANPAAEVLTGYTREELLALNSWELFSNDFRELAHELSLAVQLDRELSPSYKEIRITSRRGEERWLDLTVLRIEYEGEPAGLGTAYDLTGRKELEARLLHEAYHDPLTHLPNRAFLNDMLERLVARAHKWPRFRFSLIYLDLDGFKEVNDTLGHQTGDKLLVAFAQLLQAVLRPEDLIARLGGDEFAIVLHTVKSKEDAAIVIRRIEAALSKPIAIDSAPHFLKASMGVVVCGPQYPDVEALLRAADHAMYESKSLHKRRLPVAGFDESAGIH